ncbi:hypothetical protein C7974DRAFT_440272 [Boeremia exigua]|uniref:uncharacterized protein n=1 Tax=Boeremia exigua TaxID=749465 RepID=UPI001E8D78C3|nr:uncharacterized protein C7974DRAFT_440272 [Boeremia exigua]KAH6644733.1 hypothetical protein C7974DRAFT_440272 [Boeremia exigua]
MHMRYTLDQRMANLHITEQQQFQLALQQQEHDQHQQWQFEQQWQQQRNPRVTLNYLLADPAIYEPSPLEVCEQRRRLQHQTKELYNLESLQLPGRMPVTYQNPQPELFMEPFLTYPVDPSQGMSQDMLPDYELIDPNFYCNLGSPANGLQADYSWTDSGPSIQEATQEADFSGSNYGNQLVDDDAFDLLGDSIPSVQYDHDLSDAMVIDVADVNPPDTLQNFITAEAQQTQQEPAIEVQPQAPAARVRQPRAKTPSFSLDAFFQDFNASDDILRQPALPNHDLTGEALAKQLISELGLAFRLTELHRRWNKNKVNDWFKEVDLLDRLEGKKAIVPWGPLSDWLVMYQNELETILDRYGDVSNIDWQTERKVRADKYTLTKSLTSDLRDEAQRLIEVNKESLLELLVELTGQDGSEVKFVLDKKLRLVKAAVVNDCAVNGILALRVGPHGVYVDCKKA